jgi:hypothetical protein
MGELGHLEHLDACFVQIYEDARARVLAAQEQKALIVIDDDVLLLYRTGHDVQRFPGLRPPLYTKMKALGHMPLAVYCLLHEGTGAPLSQERLNAISAYRMAIDAAAKELDTHEEVAQGLLPRATRIRQMACAMLDRALQQKRINADELRTFASTVREEIFPVLGAAARVQLDACHAHITKIKAGLLTPAQWDDLHVLVLGPYMARQGQNFLQYFAKLLNTPMHGDRRLVYYDGEDLDAALDRLGTTMLDAEASTAIFGDRDRLHRDVLADATTRLLKTLDPPRDSE